MRSKLLIAVLVVAASACAKKDTTMLCHPVASWTQPAFRCSAPGVVVAVVEPPPVTPPPATPPRAVMTQEKITVSETIEFETDSDRLLANSKSILDEVIAILKAHPEITSVQIEGHTDSTATPDHNQKLSEDRAASVKVYLVSKGIDGGRLVTKGFGETQPIADNKTEEGRHQNRRVDFKILSRK